MADSLPFGSARAARPDDEEIALKQAASEFFSAELPLQLSLESLDDPSRWRRPWAATVELGWHGVAIPASAGGAEAGPLALSLVLEEAGRAVLPVPLLSSGGLAAAALALSPDTFREPLERLAAGQVATLATPLGHTGGGDLRWEGGALSGRASAVTDAPRAELIVVLAPDAGGDLHLCWIEAGEAELSGPPGVDPNRPLASAALDRVEPEAALEVEPGRAVSAVLVPLAAELLGVAGRALELAVEHARNREQFGRPIGSFQAVKHRLADVYVGVERARSLVYGAAAAQAEAAAMARLETSARLAKAAAAEVALVATAAAAQVLGALALSAEHPCHLLSRRARQAALLLGDPADHYRAAAAAWMLSPEPLEKMAVRG